MAEEELHEEEEEEEENQSNPFFSIIDSNPSPPKLQFRKDASIVRWDEELGLGEVTEKKGSMWTTTGITRNGRLYCHIEEILFLAERGALLLLDSDATEVTMKDIYIKIACETAGCSWDAYEAYRHLKSLGYIVGRHNTPWSMKRRPNSLQETLDLNEKSNNEVEEDISTLFKDMQIAEMEPTFNVYFPNSRFKKSSPGDPDFKLCFQRERPATRIEVEMVQRKCGSIPVKFCFVEHARISFFSFDKVELPTLP